MLLFSLARRDEIAQLALADIQEEGDIPFFRSKWRVPIHSALIRLGLLEYVRKIKDAGHTRIFPQLKRSANGYGDAVGKWFARTVTKAGITDPGVVLHSLRHGGITRLHSAGTQLQDMY